MNPLRSTAGGREGRGGATRFDATLWVLAGVLGTILVVQLTTGRWGGSTSTDPGNWLGAMSLESPALARELVASVDKLTVLTFDNGTDESIAVLDGAAEELFVYRVHQTSRLDFVERVNLRTLFNNARASGGGRR